jgi:Cd2+/Zn2+-exporting ATPase
VLIGKLGLFTRDGALPDDVAALVTELQTEGPHRDGRAAGGEFLGVLGVMDTPRERASGASPRLHRSG